ncbi:CHAT domain-containing protein [Variovorax arabinosiphilus]|uniref:CHAT domain-containing protein n=1 Tax=Variovorax arabinosiphilus TaxID=3053498 RepID=UPI002576633F|nr:MULTISPECIES: CHAT domain-containing protein [unclassified Variovorax]MDM0122585.1 CHAT domain-containing protein [Variovorax sp. J2L1-78]MDM0130886.1 CHAT domain-containing protein [Variovorax sp. J2L1-63]MDM0235348.1 CHAT domain-containing protein [Variovorax sp. J2R1-6]
MSRTLIRFQEDEEGKVSFHLEEPRGVANGGRLVKLKSLPSDTEFLMPLPSPDVRKAGMRLRDDLLSHEAVKSVLGAWLDMADRPLQSLHLQIDTSPAEALPWESLVDTQGDFLALDANAPIARVLPPDQVQGAVKREVVFTPPLRITCVLGAWWDDGGAREQALEWGSLEAAIRSPEAQNLGVSVSVFGCDPDLKAAIETANFPPNVSVTWAPIVGNALALLKRIRDSRPHLLHLFAHGSGEEVPLLRISTVADVEAGKGGSIELNARDFRQEGDPNESVWAIALNACNSASMSSDAKNLANRLVRWGFPAVIGMREPVTTVEAREMSQHFYAAAFETLASLPISARHEVEWARFLQRVRVHIAGGSAAACNTKRWLVPLLYARTEPFTIIRGQGALSDETRRRLQGEVEQLKKERDAAMQHPLSDLLKAQMRAEFDAQIQHLEAQLV